MKSILIIAELVFLTILSFIIKSTYAESQSQLTDDTNKIETRHIVKVKRSIAPSNLQSIPSSNVNQIEYNNSSQDTIIITQLNWESPPLPAGWYTNDDNGTENGDYEWGRTNCDAWEGTYSGWCAAGGDDALVACSDSYPDSCESWLKYDIPMDLSNAAAAGASFKYKVNSESGKDFLYWGISLNGRDFSLIGFSGDHHWHEMSVDFFNDFAELKDPNNRNTVYFTIIFESDGENSDGQGAFIDDLFIYKVPKEYTPPQNMKLTATNDNVNISWNSPRGIEKREQLFTDDDNWDKITTTRKAHVVMAKGPFQFPEYPAVIKGLRVAFYIPSGEDIYRSAMRVNIYADTTSTATKPESSLLVAQSAPFDITNTHFFQNIDLTNIDLKIDKGVIFVGIEQLGTKLSILRDTGDTDLNSFIDKNLDGIFEPLLPEDGTLGIRVVYSRYGSLHELSEYNLYRSTQSPIELEPANNIASLPTNLTSYNDESVALNTLYYYTMTANYSGIVSGPSNIDSIIIAQQPVIQLDPTRLNYHLVEGQTKPVQQNITLSNPGTGSLEWEGVTQTGDGGDWLSISPTNGQVAEQESESLSVTVDPASLSQGEYSGTITINSSNAVNSGQEIAINVTVAGPPEIYTSTQQVSITSFIDAGDSPPDSITLTNNGASPLNWSITTSTENGLDWIGVEPGSGVLENGQSTSLVVMAKLVNGMQKGTYNGKIIISDSLAVNSPYEISVTWELKAYAPPEIFTNTRQLSITSFIDEGDTSPDSIMLTNKGKDNLNWTVSTTTENGLHWIVVNPTSGTLESEQSTYLTVHATLLEGIQKGVHNGTIIISDSLAANSPYDISVRWELKDRTPPTIKIESQDVVADHKIPYMVEATIQDEDNIKDARLYFRKSTVTAFTEKTMTMDGDRYIAIIPGESVLPEGLVYFVSATDSYDNNSKSDTLGIKVKIPENIHTIKIPAGKNEQSYKMISCPGVLQNTKIADILVPTFGKYDENKWRLFHYANGLLEYDKAGNFEPGKAFWILAKKGGTIHFGASTTLDPAKEYEITLHPGWNQIANPFSFPLSWEQIADETSDPLDTWLYSYNEGYDTETIIEPYKGYFVKNLSSSAITLSINPGALPPVKKSAHSESDFAKANFVIQIRANTGSFSDNINFFGTADGCSDEWDSYDHAEPPALFAPLSLYVEHENWPLHKGKYTTDFRAIQDENHVWDFIVEVKESGQVDLSFDVIKSDTEKELMLYDLNNFIHQNISQDNKYSFHSNQQKEKYAFKLIRGDKEFLESALQNTTPNSFVVLPNYPNPFNQHTTIKFGIEREQQVKITIFNNLGHHIKTLADNNYRPGLHTLKWDGRNMQNVNVPSGLYFCQVKTEKDVGHIKILLIK